MLEGVSVFVPRETGAYLDAMYNPGGAVGGWRSTCVASSWNHEFEFLIVTNRDKRMTCDKAMACTELAPHLPIVNVERRGKAHVTAVNLLSKMMRSARVHAV